MSDKHAKQITVAAPREGCHGARPSPGGVARAAGPDRGAGGAGASFGERTRRGCGERCIRPDPRGAVLAPASPSRSCAQPRARPQRPSAERGGDGRWTVIAIAERAAAEIRDARRARGRARSAPAVSAEAACRGGAGRVLSASARRSRSSPPRPTARQARRVLRAQLRALEAALRGARAPGGRPASAVSTAADSPRPLLDAVHLRVGAGDAAPRRWSQGSARRRRRCSPAPRAGGRRR